MTRGSKLSARRQENKTACMDLCVCMRACVAHMHAQMQAQRRDRRIAPQGLSDAAGERATPRRARPRMPRRWLGRPRFCQRHFEGRASRPRRPSGRRRVSTLDSGAEAGASSPPAHVAPSCCDALRFSAPPLWPYVRSSASADAFTIEWGAHHPSQRGAPDTTAAQRPSASARFVQGARRSPRGILCLILAPRWSVLGVRSSQTTSSSAFM